MYNNYTEFEKENFRALARQIPCPKCGVNFGERCHGYNGKVRKMNHWERWAEYKRMRKLTRPEPTPIDPTLLRFADRFFDQLAGRHRLSTIESELAMQAFVRMPQYGYMLQMHHQEGLSFGEIEARIPSRRGAHVRYQEAIREFTEQVAVIGARWYPGVVRSYLCGIREPNG